MEDFKLEISAKVDAMGEVLVEELKKFAVRVEELEESKKKLKSRIRSLRKKLKSTEE